MTTRSTSSPTPRRGEIWLIQFDPTIGAEIAKTRAAVIVNPVSIGRLPLRIVVPVTEWNPLYTTVPWLVHLKPTARNGLAKESAADCFQVKSISIVRCVKKLGDVGANEIEEISAAIALCVGA